MCVASAHATPLDVSHAMITLPPSATLSYKINLKQSGFTLTGNSSITWQLQQKTFNTTTLADVMMIGNVLKVTSHGRISDSTLLPEQFDEKSFNKNPRTIHFNQTSHSVTLTPKDPAQAAAVNTQDRASITWQLAGLLHANTNLTQPNTTFSIPVAEPRDINLWQFTVIGNETLTTPIGNINTLHIRRDEDKRHQTIDFWFAPDNNWYPVQLHFNEKDGDFFYQTITKISPQ